MVELELSDVQIAARVGVSPPTIRKFMGSPDGELGAASRKAMLAYFREVATRNGTPIDEPPVGFIVAGDTGAPPDSAAIIEAIDRQTDMLEKVLTVLSAQTVAPERLRALEVWMDWMAANPLLPPQSARRRAKQPPAPNP